LQVQAFDTEGVVSAQVWGNWTRADIGFAFVGVRGDGKMAALGVVASRMG